MERSIIPPVQYSYAIIGGGIAGASIAYHLSNRTDEDIALFERQSLSSETTYKSVAQFGFYGDTTQYEMKRYGMRLYNSFFENTRANPRYQFTGMLMAATERESADRLKRYIESEGERSIGKLGAGFNRDLMEYIPGDEIRETLVVGPLNTDVIEGALYRPKVGYMSRPQELAYEFIERAKENGVTIREGTGVTDIHTSNGRVTGLETDDGKDVTADHVICAAGPWNVDIAESIGIDIPVKHTLAPILKLRPQSAIEFDVPIINHFDSRYTFHRRSPEELLIGYIPPYDEATRYEPETVDETVPSDIRNEGVELLADLVPPWLDADVVEQWVGVRSQTPDGNPVVGWTEREEFSIAAFHTSGIQLAPKVGDIIASQVVADDPTPFYDDLSISRFDDYEDHRSK